MASLCTAKGDLQPRQDSNLIFKQPVNVLTNDDVRQESLNISVICLNIRFNIWEFLSHQSLRLVRIKMAFIQSKSV